MAYEPLIVKGKWFVPALFLGFLLFTVGMCYGTILLGKSMRPGLERYEIARKKAEMEKEKLTGKKSPATTPAHTITQPDAVPARKAPTGTEPASKGYYP